MNALISLWSRVLPLAAPAADKGKGDQSNPLMHSLLFILVMFFIFYFLLIRPQRKRQRERLDMLGTLRKGDHVVTTGGIHGVVTLVRDREVVVKVDDNVKLTLSKSGIAHVVPQEGEEAAKSQ